MTHYDIAIVGAGMGGASLAAELAPHARIILLEAESQPGYHATGRSAAFWSETYGGPDVQPLTTASGPLLESAGVLAPLGSLHIGRAADNAAIDAFLAEFADSGVALEEDANRAKEEPRAHRAGTDEIERTGRTERSRRKADRQQQKRVSEYLTARGRLARDDRHHRHAGARIVV